MSSIHKLKWEVVNIRQLLSKVKYLKGQLRKLTKKKMLNILNIYIYNNSISIYIQLWFIGVSPRNTMIISFTNIIKHTKQ